MQVAVEKGGWELYIYIRYTRHSSDTYLYLLTTTFNVTLRYLGYNHLPLYPSIHPAIRPPAAILHRSIPFLPPSLPSYLLPQHNHTHNRPFQLLPRMPLSTAPYA
jgi:hypothetical protein